MRTSGPCRPSGRRSASTSRAGSLPWAESSRRHVVGHGLGHRGRELRVGAGQRVVDEHHVGVAAVAELETAVATHRHDRHPGRHRLAPRCLDRADHRRQRRLQGGAGDVGQRVPHLGHAEGNRQVGDADPEQLAPPDRPDRRHRLLHVLAPLGSRLHLGLDQLPAERPQPLVLAEDGHALRLTLEEVGGVAAGGEHRRHPLGDLALVAQQPEVPRRAPERLGDPAEPEQAGVRVRRVGEPLEHHRQQGALDLGAPGEPRRQRLEVPQGSVRVLVAERRQPGPRGLGREPHLVAADPGHRGEQRPVEQLLVQPADLAAVVAPLLVELADRVGGVAERSSQPSQGGLVVRQHVRTTQLVELDPVLERAQERVGLVQRAPVLAADVPPARQLGERAQRGRRAHPLVAAAVHHLQQLDGELDVAQPPGPELELALGGRGRDVVEDAPAHRLDLLDEPLPLRGRPDQRTDQLGVLRAELLRRRPPGAP